MLGKLARILGVTILLVAGVGLTLFLSLSSEAQLLPIGQGLPDREIVFVTTGIDELGFIHPDGSGYVTRTVDLRGWNFLNPFAGLPTLEDNVTWSSDGKYLVGRYSVTNRSSGIPMLISANGVFVRCPSSRSSPDGFERSWASAENKLITEDSSLGQDKIVVVDMTTCRRIAVLYSASTLPDQNEYLREGTVSTQGWLAIARFVKGEDILLIAPNSANKTIISGASFPAWSPDGEWLAYCVYRVGLFVARKDGSESRKLVDNPIEYTRIPAWLLPASAVERKRGRRAAPEALDSDTQF